MFQPFPLLEKPPLSPILTATNAIRQNLPANALKQHLISFGSKAVGRDPVKDPVKDWDSGSSEAF
jgi:hypothetical protein